jgi:hypothetical protein
MNKVPYLFAACILLLSSCSKDFSVGADYKDITAVFTILSQSDTAHYVKITKGYYDETQDNLLLAQNSDSIYYNNLEVKMEEISNGAVVNTTVLTRVDLNLEGYVKDTGIFAKSPNYAYKFKDTLMSSRKYRLKIKNLTSGKEIEGETDIISSSQLIFQNPFTNTQQLDFAVPFEIFNFAWNAPANAIFFDIALRFWYQETNTNTLATTYQYKDIPLVRNVLGSGGGAVTASMKNTDFYLSLFSELGAPPSYIVRRVDTPDLMLLAGGQVLKTYIDATTAQGGITYDQIKPNFTNLKGEDVLGIMSTRGIRTMKQIPFTQATVDSIKFGTYTQKLNIVGVSTQ